MNHKFGLIFLSFIYGCASPDRMSASPKAQQKISIPRAPFIARFQKESKILIYVGSVHHSSIEYPNAMEDPTFKTVTKAFEEESPQGVVIEGVDPIYLSGMPKYAEECAATGYKMNLRARPYSQTLKKKVTLQRIFLLLRS